MAYMCRLFRGIVLGPRLRDHVVVVPDVVQVMINMTLDLAAVAFNPIALADYVFPHVVTTFLKWDMV